MPEALALDLYTNAAEPARWSRTFQLNCLTDDLAASPPTMNEPMPLGAIAGGNRDAMIDEAQVQVLVSFPAFTVSVGDANALQAGQLVDLGVSLAQARVTMNVAGEEVARAGSWSWAATPPCCC